MATRSQIKQSTNLALFVCDEPFHDYSQTNMSDTSTMTGTLNVENICRYVQTIFRKKRVNYLVAPYSAAAQVRYECILLRSLTNNTRSACLDERHRVL